ncbi:MAG: XdhC family protein [Ignavibacteria bacterium]|nr:XdhC family protein [Ignavibacteria bacterium]
MVLNFYRKVLQTLLSDRAAVIMVVISSSGSSPGRQGFLMMVTRESMSGTIGGGMMEHKLVELSKDLLNSGRFEPFIKKQVHMSEAARDKSGMICSGEQVISFYYVDKSDISIIEEIVSNPEACISYSEEGICSSNKITALPEVQLIDGSKWTFLQSKKHEANVYIFGGGHVGLALCEILSKLDFEIHLLDNRPGLNTLEINRYANSKQVIKYEESSRYVPEGQQNFIVIMSFGYRTDEIILKSIYGRKFKYIGMMGSEEKIRKMKESLMKEGYSQKYFDSIHAPIGIDIKSETAHEIAVSVAAQLIAAKNSYIADQI